MLKISEILQLDWSVHLLKQGADKQHSGSIINGISRIGYMRGGMRRGLSTKKFRQM
ncbi:MAG: hypothetical protein ACLUKN_07295 [Bacilli bacterium]